MPARETPLLSADLDNVDKPEGKKPVAVKPKKARSPKKIQDSKAPPAKEVLAASKAPDHEDGLSIEPAEAPSATDSIEPIFEIEADDDPKNKTDAKEPSAALDESEPYSEFAPISIEVPSKDQSIEKRDDKPSLV